MDKRKTATKTTKRNWYTTSFYIYLIIFSLLLILTSGIIIPWNVFIPNSNYQMPLWARIVMSVVYGFSAVIYGFILAWNKKLSIYRFSNYIFIIGIVLTLFWIPQSHTVKGPDNKEVFETKWLVFPFDTVLVFLLCAVAYLAATFTLNEKLMDKLRQMFGKQKAFLDNNDLDFKTEEADTTTSTTQTQNLVEKLDMTKQEIENIDQK
ncbi:hypothetical protein ACNQ1M_00375 [Mycoplasma sp. VS424B]|uniref:hypothetical protein n=1 Tax=Mycoplasma sp. VS424B TaxID=3401660 RepID=UPI003AAFAA0C